MKAVVVGVNPKRFAQFVEIIAPGRGSFISGNSALITPDPEFHDALLSKHFVRLQFGLPHNTHLAVPPQEEEALPNSLDPSGLIKVGSIVSPGDLILRKHYTDPMRTPSAEERVIQTIFGRSPDRHQDCSETWSFPESALITRARWQANRLGTCQECNYSIPILPTSEKTCVRCKKPLHITHEYSRTDPSADIEALVRHPLSNGCLLKLNGATFPRCVVAGLFPSASLQLFPRVLDDYSRIELTPHIIVSSRIIRNFSKLRQAQLRGAIPGRKNGRRLTVLYAEVEVENLTTYLGDKMESPVERSFSLVSAMSMEGERTSFQFIRNLTRKGWTNTAFELLRFDSDATAPVREAMTGKKLDNFGRIRFADLDSSVFGETAPRTQFLIRAILKGLGLKLCFFDESGHEISEDDETNASLIRSVKFAPATNQERLSWSQGAVTAPDTLNFRTYRPVLAGLFCEKVFGTTKSFECQCGKLRGRKYSGMICSRCGVKIESSEARSNRFGHIRLVGKIFHPLFESKLSEALGIPAPNNAELVTDLSQKMEAQGLDPDKFLVSMWSVIPPNLRPLIQMQDGNWATDDVNDLLRRMINRSNRYQRLVDLNAPFTIQDNEARMQRLTAFDVCLNMRSPKPVLGSSNRPLRGLDYKLDETLQRLFERRIATSGRCVAIPDGHLQPNEIVCPMPLLAPLLREQLLIQLRKDRETYRSAHRFYEKFLFDEKLRPYVEEIATSLPLLITGPSDEVAAVRFRVGDDQAIRVHPELGKKLKLRFNGDVIRLFAPQFEDTIQELLHPEAATPISDESALQSLSFDKIIELAWSEEPILLTDLDRLVLGIPPRGAQATSSTSDAST